MQFVNPVFEQNEERNFLTCIKQCNQFERTEAYPFYVGEQQIGWLKHTHAVLLIQFPHYFVVENRQVLLHPSLNTYESRTAALSDVVSMLRAQKHIPVWRGEIYDIAPSYGQTPFFTLDRGATAFFGVPSYGTHLNAYTYRNNELYIWIAKRASHLVASPDKLDNLAAGGLPQHITPLENIAKEAEEEAQLNPEWVKKHSLATGSVSYLMSTPNGITPDTMFVFDLTLPENVIPQTDGKEIEKFLCLPATEVYRIIKNTNQFKYNSALVIMDFLLRQNIITREEPDYLALITGLRTSFQFEVKP